MKNFLTTNNHDDTYDEDLLRIRDLAQQNLGIHINDTKLYGFKSKIDNLLRKEQDYESYRNLYTCLSGDNKQCWDLLAKYITINYTYFMREENQLKILLKFLQTKGVKEPKIWCAASSTGEEVYSIAITLHEAGYTRYVIIASDIDKTVLHQMKSGQYTQEKLTKLSSNQLKRYFTKGFQRGIDIYTVKPFLKQNIMAKILNITEPLLFKENFHVIFCRNVLIYFDIATRIKVLKMLLKNLIQGGALFLGQSESIVGTGLNLHGFGPSVYLKKNE